MNQLSDAGATIEEIDVPWAEEATHYALASQEFLFAGNLNDMLEKHVELVSDYTSQLAETANSYTADDYRRSKTIAGEVWRDHLGPLFSKFELHTCPPTKTTPYPANALAEIR